MIENFPAKVIQLWWVITEECGRALSWWKTISFLFSNADRFSFMLDVTVPVGHNDALILLSHPVSRAQNRLQPFFYPTTNKA